MFDGIVLPITIAEMLETAFEYLGLFAPWILLGVAIIFAPQIVTFLKSLVRRGGRRSN